MAKNYGTITIMENSNDTENWATKIATAISGIIGEQLTVFMDNNTAYFRAGEYRIFRIPSVSGYYFYMYAQNLPDKFDYFIPISHENKVIQLSYISRGNTHFLKFSPLYNTSGSTSLAFILHKDGTGWEIAPVQKSTENLLDFYNITTSERTHLANVFDFKAPAGKIYTSNAVVANSTTSESLGETTHILACSNVGFDTDIRFNDKNYHAIAKNFVMEKTED